jgi:ribosomal-protein-alanine N-acetyltransferase
MKKQEIHIRRFSFSDLDRIIEIERNSFTIDTFSADEFRHWYRKCPELFIVAEVLGTIAGYVIACILPEKGNIVSIAVDPLYRRRGIGKALTNFAVDQLKANALEVVELEVRITNADGISFWENLGFSPIGTIPDFYRDGAEALCMKKLIQGNQ